MGKRKAPVVGIQLPKDSKGNRKSTPFNKGAWVAAAQAVGNSDAEKYMKRVDNEKNFRANYTKYVGDHMRLCEDSEKCLLAAESGWNYVYSNMEYFHTVGCEPKSLAECLENPNKQAPFESGIIKGSGKLRTEVSIPYKGKELRGAEAKNLVLGWAEKGVIEQDTSDVLLRMLGDDSWKASLDNKVFVLLGALSEMGPLQTLLSFGATVVAVDYCAEALQERLFAEIEKYAGTLIVPLKAGTQQLPREQWAINAGADLLYNFPEVAEWLVNVCPEKEMVIGPYCYLDGEKFVKIVSAMDGICTTVAKRRSTPTGFAYYATPTDAHMVTSDVVRASKKQSWGGLAAFFSFMTSTSFPEKDNINGVPFVDAIVDRQGPNYILAKRMQTWRAMLAREAGQVVSLNVAPTTATVSVVKNKIFALSMDGMSSLPPMEIFDTPTTKVVMGLLLIHDFWNKNSSANPSSKLGHPLNLLQKTQVHGGMYRTGRTFNTMGTPAVLIAVLKKYGLFMLLLVVAVVYFLFLS